METCTWDECDDVLTDDTVRDHIMDHFRAQPSSGLYHCPRAGCVKAAAESAQALNRMAEHYTHNHFERVGMRCPARCKSDRISRADAVRRHRLEECKACVGCGDKFASTKARFDHETKCCTTITSEERLKIIEMQKSNKERSKLCKQTARAKRRGTTPRGQKAAKRRRTH